MVNYKELTDFLVEVAKRNEDFRFVEFDTDTDAIMDPDFVCPAFVISPMNSTMLRNSVVQYGFQILYLDKQNETEDNYSDILEYGLQTIMAYLSVIDGTTDFKIMLENGVQIAPVLFGYEGGLLIGQQCEIQVQDQYNLERFKSKYYANE